MFAMPWSPQPAAGLPDLIVFDGDCVLCSRWARWVHERDRAQRFRFVAIRSEAGRALAARFGVAADDPESNIVVVDRVAYFKLDTVQTLLAALGARFTARLLALASRPIGNWLYDRVARNRYRWFGRRADCLAPDADMRARLIERATDLAGP